MKHRRATLVIYGMHTYLGAEIARFGRAMGHRMIGVVDGPPPPKTAPWMHGIHWVSDTDPLEAQWPQTPPEAICYCDTALSGSHRRFREVMVERPRRILQRLADAPDSPRFAYRSTVPQPLLPGRHTETARRGEEMIAGFDLPAAIFRMPILYGPDRPDSVAAMLIAEFLERTPFDPFDSAARRCLRVETAALAMLRAALEPEIAGIIEPDEIARLGDVMIPQ